MQPSKLALVCLLLLAGRTSAQHAILWKISKPGATNVSYIFGTFHSLGESFVDSCPVIKEKLLASDMLVTEVLYDKKGLLDGYGDRPSSDDLSHAVSPADLVLIKDVFSKNTAVDPFKLTPGELLINLNGFYTRMGCIPTALADKYTCDEYIQVLAKQNNKAAFYLEADTTQSALVKKVSAYVTWKNFKTFASPILKAYKQPTPSKDLCKDIFSYISFNYDFHFGKKCANAALVQARNEQWLKAIPGLLEQHNCFIDVGIGHMESACGIIMQLRGMGYVVEPVDMR
jgi:uncharacterized protein YbaP (TraB family)